LAGFTVVFDACVLYPASLRDLLLQLATADLFRAKWTDEIHKEWIRNLLANEPGREREKLERTRDLMNQAVLDCLVTGYEYLIPCINLPDAKDRHVVAAAVHSRPDAIVTANLKDFPADELAKHHLEAIHPDDFITYQFHLNEAEVVVAAQTCRKRLVNPAIPVDKYLKMLQKLALPKAVERLLPFSEVL
jgi:PIN domain